LLYDVVGEGGGDRTKGRRKKGVRKHRKKNFLRGRKIMEAKDEAPFHEQGAAIKDPK